MGGQSENSGIPTLNHVVLSILRKISRVKRLRTKPARLDSDFDTTSDLLERGCHREHTSGFGVLTPNQPYRLRLAGPK